jgi:hypothetical protein
MMLVVVVLPVVGVVVVGALLIGVVVGRADEVESAPVGVDEEVVGGGEEVVGVTMGGLDTTVGDERFGEEMLVDEATGEDEEGEPEEEGGGAGVAEDDIGEIRKARASRQLLDRETRIH